MFVAWMRRVSRVTSSVMYCVGKAAWGVTGHGVAGPDHDQVGVILRDQGVQGFGAAPAAAVRLHRAGLDPFGRAARGRRPGWSRWRAGRPAGGFRHDLGALPDEGVPATS